MIGHPDIETLAAVAEGRVFDDETQAAWFHTLGCPECFRLVSETSTCRRELIGDSVHLGLDALILIEIRTRGPGVPAEICRRLYDQRIGLGLFSRNTTYGRIRQLCRRGFLAIDGQGAPYYLTDKGRLETVGLQLEAGRFFGLLPPQRAQLSARDVRRLAAWIYEGAPF